MVQGVKSSYDDVFWVKCKKHYCPCCKAQLETVKVSRIINKNSPEAAGRDFTVGSGKGRIVVTGDMKFIWREFKCPDCGKQYSFSEIKDIENAQNPNSNKLIDFLTKFVIFALLAIFMGIFIFLYIVFNK